MSVMMCINHIFLLSFRVSDTVLFELSLIEVLP